MTTGPVLVADDDPDMRKLLERAAQRAGYPVVTCANADELLASLRIALDERPLPALVLTDHRMRGRPGLDIVEVIHSWGWSIPVILVTAFPDQELVDLAYRSGTIAVLCKPVTLHEMIETVGRCASTAVPLARTLEATSSGPEAVEEDASRAPRAR